MDGEPEGVRGKSPRPRRQCRCGPLVPAQIALPTWLLRSAGPPAARGSGPPLADLGGVQGGGPSRRTKSGPPGRLHGNIAVLQSGQLGYSGPLARAAGARLLGSVGAISHPGPSERRPGRFCRPLMTDRLPDAVDRHVASRVRARRLEAGMTQQQLARGLTVTFQQFQKYERAVNRISAGKLYRLALTLDVPVQYFFEGLKDRPKKRRKGSHT
jgi:Helix-turn-helix